MSRSWFRLAVAALAQALVAAAACAPVAPVARSVAAPVTLPRATTPAVGPSLFRYPWVWTDEQGQRLQLGRWRGQDLVVSALYVTCKSTCPRTIGKLEQIQAAFEREGRAVTFAIVTLDPATDTIEDLRRLKFAARFPDNWHLLAGSLADTRELADVLGIHVLDDGPHLMHDAGIVIFDAQGRPLRRYGGYSLDEETPLARLP